VTGIWEIWLERHLWETKGSSEETNKFMEKTGTMVMAI
jgi:hypothetical protein